MPASLTPLLVATLQIVLSKWPIWGLTPGVQIGYRPDTRRTEKGVTMKAAVCYEFGKPLIVEEVELEPPQWGEVRVRMVATSICHSDIHLLRGDWGRAVPVVAGHEAAGVVEEVGEGVNLVQPGNHVVVSLLRSCGRCYFCTTGSPHICEGEYALATEHRLRTREGDPIHQGLYTGAFAEQIVVDQSQLVPIPKEVPLDSAALLGCGVITGFGAVVNTAMVPPHSSVVVTGVGGVGLNAVQGAVRAGAHPIIAVDLLDSKLEVARAFGATHALNATGSAVAEAVRDLTSGRGADYVFVTVGSAAAFEQGLELTRRDGTLVLVGIPPIDRVGRSARRKSGTRHPRQSRSQTHPRQLHGLYPPECGCPQARGPLPAGGLKLDELVSSCYPLEEINEAIEVVEQGEALRNVITFHGHE